MNNPDKLIENLKMINRLEGRYFSKSFRNNQKNVSLIYYLLKENQKSHWHHLIKN